MSAITIICIAAFSLFCGRFLYKNRSIDHIFGINPVERFASASVVACLVGLLFVMLGSEDESAKRVDFFRENCTYIKGGYICKFKDTNDDEPRNTGTGRYNE